MERAKVLLAAAILEEMSAEPFLTLETIFGPGPTNGTQGTDNTRLSTAKKGLTGDAVYFRSRSSQDYHTKPWTWIRGCYEMRLTVRRQCSGLFLARFISDSARSSFLNLGGS